ncbi:MAG: OmpA family protein [Saprospiraceae bacterium]
MYRILGILLLFLITTVAACTYTQKIRDGRTAYERKQYSVATRMLGKEYKKSKSRVEKGKIAFLLGESYKALNKSDESIGWYEIAYNNQYGVDALKEYAYGLKKAERYQDAMQAFKDLGIEIGSPYEYRREILACERAIRWSQSDRLKAQYNIEVQPFNTGFADYAPVFYKDHQLVITSDRKASEGDDVYKWTGNDFSDLFLVDLQSNNVTAFGEPINSPNNEGTVSFAPDYSEVYFTRCFGPKREDAYCKLMVSESKGGDEWTIPRVLDFVQDGINYGHPSISEDGRELYFSSNHPDGWGGYDIWVSRRQEDGSWGTPDLLSRSINTIGNEKFPYIDHDTLYFSSDFLPGMGGLDIFRTHRFPNGSWAPAKNLGVPINSGGDEFGYVIDREAPKRGKVIRQGYFTSTRDNGIGNDDIYRFEQLPPPPAPPQPEPEEVVYKMILDSYILEKIFEEPGNPNSRMLARKPLPAAKVDITFGKEIKTVEVGEDGLFSLELEEDTDYSFLASKQGYLNNAAEFSTKGIGKDPENPEQRFEIEIVLDKIYIDKEIVLENIYYDFDRWEIREDAQPTLNQLAANLKLNPQISIQLSSHTDCQGTDRYNETLSQKRAQSAVDYLIAQGIDASRLAAKGYGESQLAVECICSRCTEEEHQANRRTTFKILSDQ